MAHPGLVYTDATRQMVADAVWPRIADDALTARLEAEAVSRIQSESGFRPIRAPVRLQGEQATTEVDRWRIAAESNLALVAGRRTHAEWIWLLRRLPGVFEYNQLPTTESYCRAIAEVAAGLYGSDSVRDLRRAHDLGDRLIRDFMLLWTLVGITYELHGAERWAAKGAVIEFAAGSLPDPEPDPDLDAAVRELDRREARSSPSALAGAGSGRRLSLGDALPTTFGTPIVFDLPRDAEIPLPGSTALVSGRYVVGIADLSSIPGMRYTLEHHADELWDEHAAACLALSLTVYATLLVAINEQQPVPPLHNIMSVGYEVSHISGVTARLDWALRYRERLPFGVPAGVWPRSAAEAIQTLSSVKGTIWPPRGGRVISAGGEFLLIDWMALRRHLVSLLRRVRPDGEVANKWADHFEHEVQREIDRTPWQPSDRARSMRRTLRRGGQDITDVDAVAERDGTLLMVSCKSYAFTDVYDRGDFSAVRNLRQRAEQAVDEHRRLLEELRRDPTGDNFDLSGWRHLDGIVVTPFVPFVGSEYHALRNAIGLPWLSGIAELEALLA